MKDIIGSFNRSAATYEDWYKTPLGEYVFRTELKGLEALLPTLLGVAEKLPLKPRTLSFMYLVTVIEFLVDPLEALSSLKSLLEPRTPLVALAINRESSWGQAYLESSKIEEPLFRYV